jgi:hypothetical protein
MDLFNSIVARSTVPPASLSLFPFLFLSVYSLEQPKGHPDTQFCRLLVAALFETCSVLSD